MNASVLYYFSLYPQGFSKGQLDKYYCFLTRAFNFSILKSLFCKYSSIHLPS